MSRPKPETVEALVHYGYKAETILGTDKKPGWSYERAEMALIKCQYDERIALARAARKAKAIEEERKPRGVTPQPLREIAARVLEEATSPEEIIGAFWSSSCYLTDEETVRIRGYLIRLFRGKHDA